MLKRIGRYFLRFLLVLLVTLVILAGTLYGIIYKCCNGSSEAAKATFITTILESGQLKFVASLVSTKEERDAIIDANKMGEMSTEIDKSLIQIGKKDDPKKDPSNPGKKEEVFDENGVRIEKVSGRTFFGKMMIIKDPSQVIVGTTYPFGEKGKDLDVIVSETGGIGGVNGGLYYSSGNSGGYPYGVVVSQGQIQRNKPQEFRGLYLIGMDEDNLLVIKDLAGMNAADTEKYIREARIRDAVTFQEETSDANNHFVPLIINGEGREMKGQGSGSNPRTAIGQRADGAILLFVTDGRGAGGHLGATASDLIAVMLDYGAVNAANLDGGSSSTMVYKGKYEMTSVTFYYQNGSWRLPDAMVVMPPKQ
ncbi:MAG: phosphodiester glycosidase family protein [Lachnospiraceae bacterium]|nr:phosphodiester glycosidase family protein [Lachnospiraceae bacterium]